MKPLPPGFMGSESSVRKRSCKGDCGLFLSGEKMIRNQIAGRRRIPWPAELRSTAAGTADAALIVN